jgi:hypothetical protein
MLTPCEGIAETIVDNRVQKILHERHGGMEGIQKPSTIVKQIKWKAEQNIYDRSDGDGQIPCRG